MQDRGGPAWGSCRTNHAKDCLVRLLCTGMPLVRRSIWFCILKVRKRHLETMHLSCSSHSQRVVGRKKTTDRASEVLQHCGKYITDASNEWFDARGTAAVEIAMAATPGKSKKKRKKRNQAGDAVSQGATKRARHRSRLIPTIQPDEESASERTSFPSFECAMSFEIIEMSCNSWNVP